VFYQHPATPPATTRSVVRSGHDKHNPAFIHPRHTIIVGGQQEGPNGRFACVCLREPAADRSQPFTEAPLTVTDFASALTTPNIIWGRGRKVYWQGCTSASIARKGQTGFETVKMLDPEGGEGVLEDGLVLYCKGGLMGEA
jgi:hypothetical protein